MRRTQTTDCQYFILNIFKQFLRANELKGIYTPDSVSLEIRSLIRLKNSITKDTTRQKNRIKSQLRYLGIDIPKEYLEPYSKWSKRFISWLKKVRMLTPVGRQALDFQIRHLEELRRQKLEMTRALRELAKTDRFREPLRLIMTVPGIGQATGLVFLSEICDISRFKSAEHLAACIGMIPMCHSSGEKDETGDNLPDQLGGNVAFAGCPSRFDMPEAFHNFQFGAELGDAFSDNNFPDYGIYFVRIGISRSASPFPFEIEGHF